MPIKFTLSAFSNRCLVPSKKNGKRKAENGIFCSKIHQQWKRRALVEMMLQK